MVPEARRAEPRLSGTHPMLYHIAERRFAKPLFCGKVHDLLFASVVRPGVEVRFSFNAAGGGPGCPPWDYQAVVTHRRGAALWLQAPRGLQALRNPAGSRAAL
jgi:hypothetical protein